MPAEPDNVLLHPSPERIMKTVRSLETLNVTSSINPNRETIDHGPKK